MTVKPSLLDPKGPLAEEVLYTAKHSRGKLSQLE